MAPVLCGLLAGIGYGYEIDAVWSSDVRFR
jgi:hypothetical protein